MQLSGPCRTPPSLEAGIWESLWSQLERLIGEVRGVLDRHLGGVALAARRHPDTGDAGSAELLVGRSRLLLEFPFTAVPPRAGERDLADAFGHGTPLARLRVSRAGAPSRIEASLAIEPVTGMWASADRSFGPAPLRDTLALERFFLSLIADAREE